MLFSTLVLACATHPPDHVAFVLGESGAGGIVVAPKRAAVEAERDRVTITAGRHFEVILSRGERDIQVAQAQIIDEFRLSLQEFEVHSDDTLIWRHGPMDESDQYGFVYIGELEGEPFHCRSGAGPHTREQIAIMLEACRSIRTP